MYDELAKRAYDTAVAKGFWEAERNMGEMLALISSELSEALEAHRDARPMWVETSGKPEGQAVELADAIIRCLDILFHIHGPGIDDLIFMHNVSVIVPGPEVNFGERLMMVHERVARAFNNRINQRVLAMFLAQVIVFCEAYIEDCGADPETTIRLKMDYNDTRPYKHGKAY